MKRTREVRRPREGGGRDDSPLKPKTPERKREWDKDVAPQPDEAFTGYTPRGRYAMEALLLHTTFGKGVVIGVEPQKIEVLFQDGLKKLAHGLV